MTLSNKMFNRNTLKIIALIAMTIDHIGLIFFPSVLFLRAIGRIAFPIFAYFIAEGAMYTKNYFRYFIRMFLLGLVFLGIFYVFMDRVYFSIFSVFALSLLFIYLYKEIVKLGKQDKYLLMSSFILVTLGLLTIIYYITTITKFDYGIFGVIIPVLIYLFKDKNLKLLVLIISLIVHSFVNGVFPIYICMFSLCAIPLLGLYNGEKGDMNLKYFFYLYYPLHLVILYGLAIIIGAL